MSPLQEVAQSYLMELVAARDQLLVMKAIRHKDFLSVASQCKLAYLHTKIDWIKYKIQESNDAQGNK
jgi:hypothetical protein